jgi:hypothetical protein
MKIAKGTADEHVAHYKKLGKTVFSYFLVKISEKTCDGPEAVAKMRTDVGRSRMTWCVAP